MTDEKYVKCETASGRTVSIPEFHRGSAKIGPPPNILILESSFSEIEQRIIKEYTGKKLKRKDVLGSFPLYKIKRRRDHPFGLCGFVRDTKGSSKNSP